MLKIKPPNYQFCPFCAKLLQIRIEEGKERKYCSSCKWTYYPRVGQSAGAVIIKDNKVLLVQRKREPYKGTWMFPAGFVDFDEHPIETIRREVREETGLTVKKVCLMNIFQSEDDTRAPGHLSIFYRVEVLDGHLKNDNKENQDIGWFDIQKPPKIGWKNHQKIMKFLQSCETRSRSRRSGLSRVAGSRSAGNPRT